GHDVGERLVRVVVEPDVGLDDALTLDRGRGDVVEPFGGRHGLLDRRRDEALHQFGRRTRVDRGDGDHGVLELRILPDRQVEARDWADEQDEQANHYRQHGPANEEVRKGHGQCTGGADGGARAALSLAATGAPSNSTLFWPSATIRSPGERPSRMATRSPKCTP